MRDVHSMCRTPIVTSGPNLTLSEWERVPPSVQSQYDSSSLQEGGAMDGAMQHFLEDPLKVVRAIEGAMTDQAPPM